MTVCFDCSCFTTGTRDGLDIFYLLHDVGRLFETCSFWREQRSHKPSDAGIM